MRIEVIADLADLYEKKYETLDFKIKALTPLLKVYKGNDLVLLRNKIKTYYDLACECKETSNLLKSCASEVEEE